MSTDRYLVYTIVHVCILKTDVWTSFWAVIGIFKPIINQPALILSTLYILNSFYRHTRKGIFCHISIMCFGSNNFFKWFYIFQTWEVWCSKHTLAKCSHIYIKSKYLWGHFRYWSGAKSPQTNLKNQERSVLKWYNSFRHQSLNVVKQAARRTFKQLVKTEDTTKLTIICDKRKAKMKK